MLFMRGCSWKGVRHETDYGVGYLISDAERALMEARKLCHDQRTLTNLDLLLSQVRTVERSHERSIGNAERQAAVQKNRN